MTERPPECADCPSKGYGIGYCTYEGPPNPKFIWIGQGPGEQEVETGRPFNPNAPAGSMLTRWMNQCGIPRNECWISNVVWCWLPKTKNRGGYGKESRTPTLAEIRYCWECHLGPVLRNMDPEVPIFTVGAPATKWILGLSWDKGADRYIGTPNMVVLPPLRNSDG